jgi:hypothetical protein
MEMLKRSRLKRMGDGQVREVKFKEREEWVVNVAGIA